MITCPKHAYLSELEPVSDEALDVISSCEDCLAQLSVEMGVDPTTIKLGGQTVAEEKLLSIFLHDTDWLTAPPATHSVILPTDGTSAVQLTALPQVTQHAVPKQAVYSTLLGSLLVLLFWGQQSALLPEKNPRDLQSQVFAEASHLPATVAKTHSERVTKQSAGVKQDGEPAPPVASAFPSNQTTTSFAQATHPPKAQQVEPVGGAKPNATVAAVPTGSARGSLPSSTRVAAVGKTDGDIASPIATTKEAQTHRRTTRGVPPPSRDLALSLRPIVRREGELIRKGPYQPGDTLSLFVGGNTGAAPFLVCLSDNKAAVYQRWVGRIPEDGFVPMEFQISGLGPWTLSATTQDDCALPVVSLEMEAM